MNWADIDIQFMRAAIAEAGKARDSDEIPIGAIIARSSDIIGRGFNQTVQQSDPSAHAELVAIRNAARHDNNHRLNGTTLYVTLEPCVMCVGAMIQARIQRLVFGAYDPKAGAVGSVLDLGAVREFNHRIEINGGLLHDECSKLLTDFFSTKR